MTHPRVLLAPVVGLVLLTGVATTATNVVEPSFVGRGSRTITANDLNPPECGALDLGEVRRRRAGAALAGRR